jgi:ABC transport system ATP-binding/permease protein
MPAPLLSLRSATVRIGDQTLFAGLSLALAKGERVCLIGRNGSGKSTLLKTLAGLIEPDAGERFLQPRTSVVYLPQEPDLDPAADALAATLAGLPPGDDPAPGRHRAEAELARLSIDPARQLAALSGGELRRVALARALIGAPDVLLLDEPTNHLDLPAIERLEQDLAGFRGGLVIVSHDRAFLSALCRTIWWLDRGELRVLEQGFAAFDAWSEAVLAEEEASLRRLEKRIAEETDWSHHGITARRKRNQGRLRRLDALRQERARRSAPIGSARLAAATDPAGGRLVIEADHITKRFGERTVVRDFSTRILRGDRVGIIGPNGAGKTTLLRLLTGALAPDQGRVRQGVGLAVGYVDQRRASLDLDATPWQTLCPEGGDQVLVQGQFRHVVGYLRDFLFRPEQARTPLRALSGGERNRLLLARQLATPCNLLVLDEPTNDLDMDTLDLLQEVLAEFAGTLLLVSHDRDFLDRLVTSVIAFEGDGRLQEYAGGYSDHLRQRRPAALPPAAARARSPAKAGAAAGPARLASRRQRDLDRVIGEIGALEAEIEALERALSDPDLFGRDPRAFHQQTEQLAERRVALHAAEERWSALEDGLAQAGI